MEKLTPEQQLEMFQEFGMIVCVEAFINDGQTFCEEAEKEFLQLPAPLTRDHILLYFEQGHTLSEAGELKLFDFSDNYMLLENYCFAHHHALCPKAQLRLLDLPESERNLVMRYIRSYKKSNELSPEFREKAREMRLMDVRKKLGKCA